MSERNKLQDVEKHGADGWKQGTRRSAVSLQSHVPLARRGKESSFGEAAGGARGGGVAKRDHLCLERLHFISLEISFSKA